MLLFFEQILITSQFSFCFQRLLIMSRPIQAEIDLAALQHNFFRTQAFTTHSRHFAVVKANAYGHGQVRVARALHQVNANGFATLRIEDALELRQAGLTEPILLLEGLFSYDEVKTALEQQMSVVVHHSEQLHLLQKFVLEHPTDTQKIDVFLKINSGMNRLGLPPNDVLNTYLQLKACPIVRDLFLMTHFALADEAEGVQAQMEVIYWVTEQFKQYDLELSTQLRYCLANSAAIMRYPETHFDWVRPGVMLYGSSPFTNQTAAYFDLKPVMTLKSHLIGIQELNAGDRVGYGALYTAQGTMCVGIVACGYADGYPRHAETGTPIMVDGVRTQTLGRVSMDMLCVDLSHIPQAHLGSEVILWGKGLPIDEVAAACGTISYELMCAIAPRVKIVEV